jgi:tetratricopeptide (TPR) repeat protein
VSRSKPVIPGLAVCALLLLALPSLARAANPRAYQLVRQCLEEQREEAVRACRAALAEGLPPRRAAVVNSVLALHLANVGRFEEAASAYRALVKLRPDDPQAQLRLSDALLLGQGRPTEALEAAQTALRLRPDWPEAFVTLGLAEAALERFEEAAAAFEHAAVLDPEIWDRRPAAREVYEAAKRGRRWAEAPQKSKPIQNEK